MALTRPRGFEGQVRGVSHHGQEIDLHLKVGYIDADIPSFTNFSLAFRRRTIHCGNYVFRVAPLGELVGYWILKISSDVSG
jgi:hypothetical protein